LSDHVWGVCFEIYLVAGTGFLFAALLNPRMKQISRHWELFFRPDSTALQFTVVKVCLLLIFVALTILHTLSLMGRYSWNSQ
jgi:hypothetical protein